MSRLIAIDPLTDAAFAVSGNVMISLFKAEPRPLPLTLDMMARHPAPGQALNCHRNTWNGVQTPLSAAGLFAVADRIGDGPCLEEHWFDTPYSVEQVTEPASAGLA